MLKTCILHDYFVVKWWAERLTLIIRDILDCEIFMDFADSESFSLSDLEKAWKAKYFWSQWKKGIMRHLKLKYNLIFNTKFLKNYDTVLYTGDSTSAIWNTKKWTKNILYINTIPRHLFDQKETYLKKTKWFMGPFYVVFVEVFKFMYLKELSKLDLIIANSNHVAERIAQISWRNDILTLYPCVELDRFVPQENAKKEYYLSFWKLAHIKRIDKIIEAFASMPDKKLKVIYGNNDPQKDEFLELWKWFSNIEFVNLKNNNELTDYINNSIATIFIPENEDFGMVAIESMACGVPVIWIDDGWVRETVIDWQTWILIDKRWDIEDLMAAVETMNLDLAQSMRENCITRVQEFSFENFSEQLKKLLS